MHFLPSADGSPVFLRKRFALSALFSIISGKTAGKIGKVSVEIKTKAGEGGRIFGSITSKDIADALKAQHNITVDKKKILLDSPIKQTGEMTVEIKLYTDVNAKLKVVVNAQ